MIKNCDLTHAETLRIKILLILKGTFASAHKSPWIPQKCGNLWYEGGGLDLWNPLKWGFVYDQNAWGSREANMISKICGRGFHGHFASKGAPRVVWQVHDVCISFSGQVAKYQERILLRLSWNYYRFEANLKPEQCKASPNSWFNCFKVVMMNIQWGVVAHILLIPASLFSWKIDFCGPKNLKYALQCPWGSYHQQNGSVS